MRAATASTSRRSTKASRSRRSATAFTSNRSSSALTSIRSATASTSTYSSSSFGSTMFIAVGTAMPTTLPNTPRRRWSAEASRSGSAPIVVTVSSASPGRAGLLSSRLLGRPGEHRRSTPVCRQSAMPAAIASLVKAWNLAASKPTTRRALVSMITRFGESRNLRNAFVYSSAEGRSAPDSAP